MLLNAKLQSRLQRANDI